MEKRIDYIVGATIGRLFFCLIFSESVVFVILISFNLGAIMQKRSGGMKFKEHLTWILDKRVHRFNDEDKYQQNIDFVHSLGKKCDCVGWSELDMDEPDADEVLDKIEAFCKEQGWRARGWYE